MTGKVKNYWYSCGLHFECTGCGNCCAGPEQGDIWITAAEIELLARHLGMPEANVRKRFITRIGFRTSIIEDKRTKDCIFLQTDPDGKRGCTIYPARPNQCRTWPFWSYNLNTPDDWNKTAQKCLGINRGPLFTLEQIEQRRTQKKWWE
jgi:Fe-S-cluster containining protein